MNENKKTKGPQKKTIERIQQKLIDDGIYKIQTPEQQAAEAERVACEIIRAFRLNLENPDWRITQSSSQLSTAYETFMKVAREIRNPDGGSLGLEDKIAKAACPAAWEKENGGNGG